ncbi:methyl-accepting chemotaxis protein [Rhodoferax sp. U11-2br]|uniref:methyl-accepting chemotaxis protein n=1 Tax=Rhodoferax sp. U11-2br TaxID=2838878 RepID=UPI001BE70682|nr:methyl-accepting chemotaxis protein [Rhodoferax sp. U11-2br]MBT3067185.1 MCP four helix bundle domain-containing protein [Rhodoferax sp. U11-2br]
MKFELLMRRLSIRMRMWGAIGMVSTALCLIGGIGIAAQLYANSITVHLVTRDVTSMTEVGHLQQAMRDLRINEKDMVIQYENSVEASKHKEAWTAAYAQIEKSAQTLSPLLPEEEQRQQLTVILNDMQQFKTEFAPMATQLENMGFPSAQVAAATIGKLQPIIDRANASLTALASELQTATETNQQELQVTLNKVIWLIVGMTLLVLAIIIPLTLANMNSICHPIDQAERMARAIATGDLTRQQIDTGGNDETTHLLVSLSDMQTALTQLVGQVRNTTDSIATASAEIASGNQDLSVRTELTANQLQQSASSMDQLTATVRQSAQASQQANQLAASAGQVAARGGQVVAQVVSTMNDIQVSSRKISDIISVIDGIAFQTNILALNAAVEAARAGEQGRGFAVVASEVRSLAGRSAAAAKEIKGLIGASVERIDAGTRLVTDAGQTMEDIVASVQRVTDIMADISRSSSEQDREIQGVNAAVANLDEMTQQNAALVEQSAAAAQSMREQAQVLSTLVATFKLNDIIQDTPRLVGSPSLLTM